MNKQTIRDNYITECNAYLKSNHESHTKGDYNLKDFIHLPVNISRKYAYGKLGVLDLNDIVQFGNVGLVEAWNRLDNSVLEASDSPVDTIKGFLARRIFGAINRGIRRTNIASYIPEEYINKVKDDYLLYIAINGDQMVTLKVDILEKNKKKKKKISFVDISEVSEECIRTEELMSVLVSSMTELNELERKIVDMSYGIGYKKPYKQEHMSRRLKISTSSIKKIKKVALDKLEKELNRRLYV